MVILYFLYRSITWGEQFIRTTAFGGSEFQSGQFERLVGYIFFFLIISVIQNGPNLIRDESEIGVFEEIYLNPLGLRLKIIMRGIASIISNLIPLIILAIFSAWNILLKIQPMPLLIVLILLITSLGMQGLGFIISGIALIVKKTQVLVNILTLGLLVLSVTSVTSKNTFIYTFLNWFPFTKGINLLSNTIIGNPITSKALFDFGNKFHNGF